MPGHSTGPSIPHFLGPNQHIVCVAMYPKPPRPVPRRLRHIVKRRRRIRLRGRRSRLRWISGRQQAVPGGKMESPTAGSGRLSFGANRGKFCRIRPSSATIFNFCRYPAYCSPSKAPKKIGTTKWNRRKRPAWACRPKVAIVRAGKRWAARAPSTR